MDKPKRRYELTLELGADDLESLKGSLNSILFDLGRHSVDIPIDMVSGGYNSSYTLKINVDTDITHDSWLQALNEYLEKA